MNPPRDAVRHRCSSSTRRRCAAATHRTFPVYLLGGARGNSQARLPKIPFTTSKLAAGHPRPVPHPAADILQHAGALRRLGTLFFVLAVFGRPVISRSRPHAVNILGSVQPPRTFVKWARKSPLASCMAYKMIPSGCWENLDYNNFYLLSSISIQQTQLTISTQLDLTAYIDIVLHWHANLSWHVNTRPALSTRTHPRESFTCTPL